MASPESFIAELSATYAELDQITISDQNNKHASNKDKNAKNDLNKFVETNKRDDRARHAYTEFVLNMVTAKSYGNAEKSVRPELGIVEIAACFDGLLK